MRLADLMQLTGKERVIINGVAYYPKGQAIYVTQSDPNEEYTKIFFADHYVLVAAPENGVAYFGQNVGSVGEIKKEMDYRGHKYKQTGHDYQMLKRIVFGWPLDIEGETEFWDYESDRGKLLSAGLVKRTNERADVVADAISEDQIMITGGRT